MNEDLGALLPEVALAAGAVIGLLVGTWVPRRSQWIVGALAIVVCVFGLVATAVAMRGVTSCIFDSYVVDPATNAARLIVLGGTVLVLCLSRDALRGHPHEAEFYVLVLLGALGAVLLAGADDLVLLFSAYLLASVPLYVLSAFWKDPAGVEASLKYYLIGALLGVGILAGIAVLIGATGSSAYGAVLSPSAGAPRAALAVGFLAVLAGLLFKAGAVPIHFWVPDVAEGASAPVAAFVTSIPKVGGLVAVLRLFSGMAPSAVIDWRLAIALVGAASMTLGNLGAFFQTSVRRLLAYSTISQVGYVLMAVVVVDRSPLAQPAILFYLAAYVLTNLGAFGIVCAFPAGRTLNEYRGLARRRPGLAIALLVCLLGLVGTPPSGIFVGKLEVFSAAIDGGYAWLAVFGLANTVASLFYYLRWIAPVFLSAMNPSGEIADRPGRWAAVTTCTAAAASVLLGIAGGVALPLAQGPLIR